MNVIDFICNEGINDPDANDKQAERLIRIYEEGTDEQKKALDDAFICICGWSFLTIQEKAPAKDVEDYL